VVVDEVLSRQDQLTETGWFTHPDREAANRIRAWAGSPAVVSAISARSLAIHGDLNGGQVFVTDCGYRVTDWLRSVIAPAEVDLVSLLVGKRVEPHGVVGDAAVGIFWLLRLHGAVVAQYELFPEFTALQALRDHGRIRSGHKVLVNGAAGGVGTFAVQIAKALGAEVTGVCSTPSTAMVASIGADQVIDYTRQDFTRTGQRYDLLVDIAGNRTLAECRRVLAPRGVLVGVGGPNKGRWIGPMSRAVRMLLISPVVSQKMAFFLAQQSRDDLACLRELLQAGKLRPVIDRTYPLSEVPQAIRYLEQGHARGKVVITV
jgi:hypothetical protein